MRSSWMRRYAHELPPEKLQGHWEQIHAIENMLLKAKHRRDSLVSTGRTMRRQRQGQGQRQRQRQRQ